MIGVIGGYGKLGHNACLALQKLGMVSLKIGGRNPKKGESQQKEFFPNAIWQKVDVEDLESIKNFIMDCELIINFAAPSHKYSRKIAKVCLEQNINLVDAGLDNDYAAKSLDTGNNVVVYAAGATPGFSGLFPLWFAKQFDEVSDLISYYGTLGTISAAGAEDYLEGSLHSSNIPRAAWREGVIPNVLSRKNGITLPFFLRDVALFPIFDDETKIVAEKLNLKTGEWYIAGEGQKTVELLDRVGFEYQNDPKKTIKKLCFAAEMDSLGRSHYFTLLLQLTGTIEDDKQTKTAVLNVNSITEFSGNVTAVIAFLVLKGHVKSGMHHTASIANIDLFMEGLKKIQSSSFIQVIDSSIEDLQEEEEGAL